jgi:hypothetical protein
VCSRRQRVRQSSGIADMPVIKRVVLDVLKPHQPNALEFASAIAGRHDGCLIRITVIEVDEKTESTLLEVQGEDVPYDGIVETINSLGASVHSIDEVEVSSAGMPRD